MFKKFKYLIFMALLLSLASFADVSNTNIEIENPNLVKHRINHVYLVWDPYEGNYIDEYNFILDDDTMWEFGWMVYEKHKISLRAGDEVEICYLYEDKYLMITPAKEGKPSLHIIFTKKAYTRMGYECFLCDYF